MGQRSPQSLIELREIRRDIPASVTIIHMGRNGQFWRAHEIVCGGCRCTSEGKFCWLSGHEDEATYSKGGGWRSRHSSVWLPLGCCGLGSKRVLQTELFWTTVTTSTLRVIHMTQSFWRQEERKDGTQEKGAGR